jgi:tetratricopeptide (TPR) repeat protein
VFLVHGPRNPDGEDEVLRPRWTCGLIYLKLGEWDLAIADYDSALRLDPQLATSLYGRGLARLKKGDTSEGSADVAAAEKLEANIVADFLRYGVQ